MEKNVFVGVGSEYSANKYSNPVDAKTIQVNRHLICGQAVFGFQTGN
jgi:hypothetical protein